MDRKMGLKQYNLVNQHSEVTPDYDLGRETERRDKTYIKLYFDRKGRLIIIGAVDNNYIYWASVTETQDVLINEAIFNYISKGEYSAVSRESGALCQAGIYFRDLRYYYQAILIRDRENGMAWKTPFGHYYNMDQGRDTGRFFAHDAAVFPDILRKKSELRECNGAYRNILQQYIEYLEKADYMEYDSQVRLVRELLSNEEYLKMSGDSIIREQYIQCMDLIGGLYNAYMSAVRD